MKEKLPYELENLKSVYSTVNEVIYVGENEYEIDSDKKYENIGLSCFQVIG